MILLENKAVKVEFDPTIPSVIWTPLEFMSGEEWRQPFVVGMDFYTAKLKELPNLGWLNDTRKLKPTKPEDIHWLNLNVNEKAYRANGKKVAFVLPENIFGKMAIKLYIQFTTKREDNRLEIRAFKSIGEARIWLKGTQGVKIEEIKLT